MDKILTVDDDQLFLEALKRGLKKYETHFQSFFASSVDEAIKVMKNERIAVLITDIVMPGKGGLELFAHKDRFHPRMQCVIMTGYGNEALRHCTRKDDSFYYLEKPFEINELGRTIMRALWARDEGRVVNPLLMSTLLKLIQAQDETCILGVENIGGGKGTLYFINGLLCGAECGDLKGHAAMQTILAWQRVNFSFHKVLKKTIEDHLKNAASVFNIDEKQGFSKPEGHGNALIKTAEENSFPDFEDMIQASLDNIEEETVWNREPHEKTGEFPNDSMSNKMEIQPPQKPLRLLIVDDSAVMRKALADIFEPDHGLQIVGECKNGVEALNAIQRTKVDVMTLDVEMPTMDGLTTLKHLMIKTPVPTVMVSSLTQEGAAVTFDALKLGAVDFVSKPSRLSATDMAKQSSEIIRKVKMAADVEIRSIHLIRGTKNNRGKNKGVPSGQPSPFKKVFTIGAAEGGYSALLKILPLLPQGFQGACLVMLHAESEYVNAFVQYIDEYSRIKIKRAVNGEVLQGGHCYFFAEKEYLTLEAMNNNLCLQVTPAPMFNTRSNINIMMFSAAEMLPQHTTGIILSGSGTDGCEGMEEIHRVGGKTMVQAPESCTYKEMAESVIKKRCAQNVLPDIHIAREMINGISGNISIF